MTMVKDVLTKKVDYISPDTNVADIARLMEKDDCGFIPVAENDKLIGVVTDRDIVLRCTAKNENPAELTARDIMTPKILYCYDDITLEEAADNMAKNQVRRLPVMNRDKKLVGVVSLGDLALQARDREICGEALRRIAA